MKKTWLLYSFNLKDDDHKVYIVQALVDRSGKIFSAQGKDLGSIKGLPGRGYYLDDNTNTLFLESIGQDKKDLENLRDMNLELKDSNINDEYFVHLMGGIKFYTKNKN